MSRVASRTAIGRAWRRTDGHVIRIPNDGSKRVSPESPANRTPHVLEVSYGERLSDVRRPSRVQRSAFSFANAFPAGFNVYPSAWRPVRSLGLSVMMAPGEAT